MLILHSFCCQIIVLEWIYTTFRVFICQLMGICFFPVFGYYEWYCYKHFCKSLSVNVSFHFSGMYLVGYMVTLCLSFWGTARRLSKAIAPVYISTSSARGFQFLHILSSAYYLFFFFFTHPRRCGFLLWFWTAFP